MSLKILIPFILFFVFKRTVRLVNAIKNKNNDSIKFEIFLFAIVFITSLMLIYFASSKVE